MKLSLIISTYKRPQLLKSCLLGAVQILQSMDDAEVIVINDSKTDSVTVPQHERMRVFDNPKQGVASARNLGASKAAGELLLFVDDDIEFTAKNVQALLAQYYDRQPACYNTNWRYSDEMYNTIKHTQFGRFLIRYGLVDYKGWVPGLHWKNDVFEAEQLAAFFLLIPKVFFDQVGGFNETFINQGAEDDELCKRFREAGIKMYVDPNNFVFHNEMDRVTLETRVTRYYHGAINRRRAFELGISNIYETRYPASKKLALDTIKPMEPLLFLTAKLIPNKIAFDRLYFRIANGLIALAIYKGYTQKDKRK